jgi:hypothetical protein
MIKGSNSNYDGVYWLRPYRPFNNMIEFYDNRYDMNLKLILHKIDETSMEVYIMNNNKKIYHKVFRYGLPYYKHLIEEYDRIDNIFKDIIKLK